MFARLNLRGARGILTGASSGIGRALAVRLAAEGVRLVLASRSPLLLESLAEEIRGRGGEASAVVTDVTNPDQRAHLVDQAVARLGGLDLLINNAGVGAMGWFAEASEARLRRVFEVNFFGCTELTRLVLPHLRQGSRPMLVNISSVLGRRAIPGCTEYCASKFALTGWSEGLRTELARLGIHVLLVCPGVTETPFREHMVEDRLRFGWQEHRAMSAADCADRIVRAMRRRKNEVVLTAQGKFLVGVNRLAPRLLDYLLARFARPKNS
jgi:short-subunit dehydrogenase